MIEEIHQCLICRGRFSDETLLLNHVCPAAPGNEYIEIDEQTLPLDQRHPQSPPSPYPDNEGEDPFPAGTAVRKNKGYSYPGVVVSSFTNLKGDRRYVVECTVEECAGMLHIYNGGQLERA